VLYHSLSYVYPSYSFNQSNGEAEQRTG